MTNKKFNKYTIALTMFMAMSTSVHASTTDIATAPLITSSSSSVLPNLLFILDDSGSMDWTYMPDAAGNFAGRYGYSSSQCNGVYYDPTITYTPPVTSTGTSYANASFTSAWKDGFNTSSGTVNLSTSFQADSGDIAAAAYYYMYSGTQTTAKQKDYYNTSGVFYKECNSLIGSTTKVDGTHAVNTIFTKKTVSSTSGTGSTDERTNFANWYSYYRKRMLMMKTSAGLAFKSIDNHYRVAFMTINNNVSPGFLNFATFDSTQKSAWYTKLYNSQANNSTPLRQALSSAGRIYAGKQTSLYGVTVTDPIQYSCQQNFTILSTDGFWNGSSGFTMDGSTAVGNQDANESRPMYDGGAVIVTAVTPTTTVVQNQTVTQNSATTVWTQDSYSVGSLGSDGCSSSRRKLHVQEQRRTETKATTTTSVDNVTTTSTRTVVTTNGTVTSDTTATSTSSANVSSSTTTNSDTFTSWTNYGSYYTSGSCKSSISLPSPNPSTASQVSSSSTTTSGPTTTVLSTTGPTVGSTTTTTTTSGGTSDTLADVAEYYYKTDLRDSSLGNTTGALGTDVSSNNVPSSGTDSASWQHMTTFTLGLGARGRMVFSSSYLSDTSGDYFDVKNGSSANSTGGICSWQSSGTTCNWPTPGSDQIENIDDLWHAAVNGRGTYFSATNPATLVTGLSSALSGVSARTSDSAAATTSNPNVATGDNFVFSSTFTSVEWDGQLTRQQIDLTNGTLSATIDWAAQSLLDANTSRSIYTYDPSASNRLKSFAWASLTATEQGYFNTSNISSLSQFCSSGTSCLSAASQTAAAGSPLVSFLRGDRTNEGPLADTTKYYRQRTHVLGDIVNSEAVYVKAPMQSYADAGYGTFKTANTSRQGMVYVAANDGMLHAFNADTGAEAWAYLPSLVLPTLYKLADKNYSSLHQYFVDGTPAQGDAYFGGAWHTILVGGLNGGGRGYYALDITDPAAPKALWELTYDTTKGSGYVTDANLGYTFGKPEITKLRDGTWVVLVTSGYNNVTPGDGQGHLYVLNASTGAKIRDIATGVGSASSTISGVCSTAPCPSGLAQIRAWADNSMYDNTATRVYGGDLYGNLWRFDVNGDVGASGYDAQLLATLRGASGNVQPVTARPEVGDVSGNAVVYVGTGRLMGTTDLTDTSAQTLYAVKDGLGTTNYGNPRSSSNFIRQTLTTTTCPTGSSSTICSSGQSVRTSTNLSVNFSTDYGWYVDLPDTGERASTDPQLALGTLAYNTNVPDANACTVGGYSWAYYFDYRTGGPVSTSTTNVVSNKLGNALATRPVLVRLPNNTIIALTRLSDGSTVTQNVPIGGSSTTTKRVSWRELVTDQ